MEISGPRILIKIQRGVTIKYAQVKKIELFLSNLSTKGKNYIKIIYNPKYYEKEKSHTYQSNILFPAPRNPKKEVRDLYIFRWD